ncbi:MAG: hypothetical protein HY047_20215 [Acidobacteria bacterium]|nr:hypothetical protein [Acidobacteriota bacterium]
MNRILPRRIDNTYRGLVLAVMIWSTWPSSAAWVIGTLVGISMLFSGMTRVMLSLAVRRIVA